MKTNKFKVKNNRRKRNNSRSLSVKRSSLKEKISISQNEAKAEAILRQHPELAFLITKDKKTKDEPNGGGDLSVEENNVIPKEESPSPARTQIEEKKPTPSETKVPEIPTINKYERTSEVKEKSITKVVDIKVIEQGRNEKENKPLTITTNDILKGEKSREPATKSREDAAPVQGTVTTNIQYKSKTETKEHALQEKTTSKLSANNELPSGPPHRSPSSGRRQLPADPPTRVQQTTKENYTIKSSHTSQGIVVTKEQRMPAAKPLSELSSNSNTTTQSITAAAPKSTKTRAAPPVPRSSGSMSGRSQLPSSDTSGYPDSFSKRKSRDSRELTDVALQQLAKDIKESRVISPSDVKLSSEAVSAKYTPKPTSPPSTQHNNTAATLEVSSDTAPTKKTPVANNITNSSVEEPIHKFKQPNDVTEVEVERQAKKSCCVLM